MSDAGWRRHALGPGLVPEETPPPPDVEESELAVALMLAACRAEYRRLTEREIDECLRLIRF